MEANLVDLVDAQNAKSTDNFEENSHHDKINENEKSDVKSENIEDVKLDTVQLEVPNIKITCENELNLAHSTSSQYSDLDDSIDDSYEEVEFSYNNLRITPSKTETTDDVITIHDESSVIIVHDESHKENSLFETNQSIDPSKNLNKTYPEEKSFQNSKINISTSDVQEKDSNKSSKDIEDSLINTMQNGSCVEILDDDDNKKRTSLNQLTSSAFESTQHLEESLVSTRQNESCGEILDIDNKKRTSLNPTSSAFESSQNSEEVLISPRVGVLDNDNKQRASLNQNSSAFDFSLRLEESLINTTQNKSCIEILDNDNKKRISLNQTSHSEHPEESLINTTQNESCVETLNNGNKNRASLNQTSAFESSLNIEESLVNTTQNKSCAEILDGANKKRTSLNQTSTSAFESSHSEHPEESLINTTQDESSVKILSNGNQNRASFNQTSAFESSLHTEESLNTTQNKSCAEILDVCAEVLDNDNKKRTSLNQTSNLEESCIDILDNNNKKRTTLNKAPSTFEPSQQLTTNDLIDLNGTYSEEKSGNKVVTDIQNSEILLDEFAKKDLNEATAEIDKCLVNSCKNIVHYQPNESVGSDNKKISNVNKTPVLESTQRTNTYGSIVDDSNKTFQEERSFLNPENNLINTDAQEDSHKSSEEVENYFTKNSSSETFPSQQNEFSDNQRTNINKTLLVLEPSQSSITTGSKTSPEVSFQNIENSLVDTKVQDSKKPKEEDEKSSLNASNQTFQHKTSLGTKMSEDASDGNGEKLQSINQNETFTTYEEEIEEKLNASESTNLLNQTFSEASVNNKNSALNSTETDLVMALEALNINCDEKDETFLSCQDAFEESARGEDFEATQNATTNEFDSGVHNCDINNTFQMEEKCDKASIGAEICDTENIKTEEEQSRAANDDQICTSNENDNSVSNEAVSVDESSENNKNSSTETVIQDDNELNLAVVPDVDVISPNKSVRKLRLSDVSNDDTLIDYNSLLEASPSVFDRRASMFGKQSDLKLYVNELEQRISKLQIELCKKERIILKQQMAGNGAEKSRKFEENNGQSESNLLKNLSLELEKAKRNIAQMKIAHESEINKLNQKLAAQEEKYKELEQNNTENALKAEKETSDKNKIIDLLDKSDSLMAYMSTKNKELVEEKTRLEKKLYNIDAAFKEVIGKYEQCKVIIVGLKKNEEIYKREIDELRNALKRHDEIYATFKKDAETKLKEASEQIANLQQSKLQEEKAKLIGKRRYK